MKKQSKNSNKKQPKISQEIKDGLRFIADGSYQQRMQELQEKDEFGYAILVLWNRFETIVKLIRSLDQKKYPDTITCNWKFLQDLKQNRPQEWNDVMGSKNNSSLRKIRNKIVHQNKTITEEKYDAYKASLQTLITYLTPLILGNNEIGVMFKTTRSKSKIINTKR